jgi:hypothetical protein
MIEAFSYTLLAPFYLLCPRNIKTIFLATQALLPFRLSRGERVLIAEGRVEI